jgi:hypothetical protein
MDEYCPHRRASMALARVVGLQAALPLSWLGDGPDRHRGRSAFGR